jgi:hypothetical protein
VVSYHKKKEFVALVNVEKGYNISREEIPRFSYSLCIVHPIRHPGRLHPETPTPEKQKKRRKTESIARPEIALKNTPLVWSGQDLRGDKGDEYLVD